MTVNLQITDETEQNHWTGTHRDLLQLVGTLDEQQRQRISDGSELDEIRERMIQVEKQRSESNQELLRTQAHREQKIRELTRQIEES
ncbi:hypothetical protein CGJ19_18945 [Vibrio parahaemolyticus]|nr:hypothetical protein CGJ19_18945 [Vibrio parahaemolyticus]